MRSEEWCGDAAISNFKFQNFKLKNYLKIAVVFDAKIHNS